MTITKLNADLAQISATLSNGTGLLLKSYRANGVRNTSVDIVRNHAGTCVRAQYLRGISSHDQKEWVIPDELIAMLPPPYCNAVIDDGHSNAFIALNYECSVSNLDSVAAKLSLRE